MQQGHARTIQRRLQPAGCRSGAPNTAERQLREEDAMSRSFTAGLSPQAYRERLSRPADLRDDIAFIEAACGRRLYSDARFPILQ